MLHWRWRQAHRRRGEARPHGAREHRRFQETTRPDSTLSSGRNLAALRRWGLGQSVDTIGEALEIGGLAFSASPQLLYAHLRLALLAHGFGDSLALRECSAAKQPYPCNKRQPRN